MFTSATNYNTRGIPAFSGRRTDYRLLFVYLAVTIAAIGFFLIYDQFSHDVRSPYMTFLFVRPLLLGVLPAAAGLAAARSMVENAGTRNRFVRYLADPPGTWTRWCWGSGVAAVTLSSMLTGIFEIAGTASVHSTILLSAGVMLLLTAAILHLFRTL